MLATETLASSTLLRSKTAPTPLVDSPGASVPRWGRVGRINTSITSGFRKKPASYGHASANGDPGPGDDGALGPAALVFHRVVHPHPSLVSPRHDIRDDPFNLAGFFPSRPGSPEHPVEWAWRSSVEETVVETEEESEQENDENDAEWGNVPAGRSLSMTALDDYAREVIAKESELGILALARVPSFLKSIRESYFGQAEEEDQQAFVQTETPLEMSSAAIDEPFDDESLWESMHSRRVASEGQIAMPERVRSLGLFSPESETREAELEWASGLYMKILGPKV